MQRRDNYRKMDTAEYAALAKSVERFGFKSFVVVEEIEPGSYGIVDGHHRRALALERGVEKIPVVLLDGGTPKEWADLAMITFNVTGKPIADKYMELLMELSQSIATDELSELIAVDKDFLSALNVQMDDALASLEQESAAGGDEDKPTYQGQGRSVMIELPRVEGIQELLAAVQEHTGQPVLGQAVLVALRQWVGEQHPASDEEE